MAEDRAENEGLQGDPDLPGGPAAVLMPFVVMDNLLDKLKLLDYDRNFVRQLRMKPISRHYFAVPTNSGEQFYIFSSLAAWLVRKCAKSFEQPQEFDDPNSTVSNILDSARQLGISVDFPPSKLKQGCGDQVIFVLDRLADEALKVTKFSWKKPRYPQEEAEEDIVVDDESELTLAKIEEDLQNDVIEDSDEDGDYILGLEELRNLSSKPKGEPQYSADILQTNTDTTEWKLELERVLPQLKVSINNDSKDWRNRLDQMHQLHADVEKCFAATGGHLDKLQIDISRSLEKIRGREKYLNSQLESQLTRYSAAQQKLSAIREQYREVSGGVVNRSRQLADVKTTDELESVKQEIEERSSAMTDGSPLINIKKALARIKSDIVAMDVQLAVVEHSLLHAKLKDRNQMQREMSASMAATSPFSNTSAPIF